MLALQRLGRALALVALVAVVACAPSAAPPARQGAASSGGTSAATDPAARLQQLVEGAKQEGSLTILGLNSVGHEGAEAIAQGFKQAYGLNIDVKYDIEGQEGANQTRAMTEYKNGLPPTYDVLEAITEKVVQFCNDGACQPVPNWQALLPAGVPAAEVSPKAVEGLGFKFADRTKAIVYNTQLIKADELPKTTRDLGDRYRGRFYTAPWASAAMYGVVVYPKDEWLTILSAWGANKAATIESDSGTRRMMLGEFAFEPFGNAYAALKSQKNGDPAGLAFFQDVVPLQSVYHLVLNGSRHPNAATLFTMWSTGPEFNRVFEQYTGNGNQSLDSSTVGKTERETIKTIGAHVVDWLETPETLSTMQWYSTTPEGQAYQEEILKALKNK